MRILIIGGCGYIGSKLFLHLKDKHDHVDTLDLEWFGNVSNPNNIKRDLKYIVRSPYDIGKKNGKVPTWFPVGYDVYVLLAGHSSVPMCLKDRKSSFKNNVVNFVGFLEFLETRRRTCGWPEPKFIYASSSSVYGNTGEVAAPEDWDRYDPKTFYDLQKQEIDYYAQLSDVEYYGLRFGTVNGWSPNLRTDIMINKMYQCASEDNKITIFNPQIHRPILGIQDLCEAVDAIIAGGDHRGIYNLASFNATVEEIASSIQNALGQVDVENKGETPTYNFSIDTSKFKKTYDFEFNETVDSIVHSLVGKWHETHKGIRERHPYV